MSKDLTNVFKYMRRHEKLELLEFTTQAHKQGFQQASHDVLGHTSAQKAPAGEMIS